MIIDKEAEPGVGGVLNTNKFTQKKKERTDSQYQRFRVQCHSWPPDCRHNSDHVVLATQVVPSGIGCGGSWVKPGVTDQWGCWTHRALWRISLDF